MGGTILKHFQVEIVRANGATHSPFSLTKLSSALLRGVGLTACLASLGAVTAGTAWADNPVRMVLQGPDGVDGGTLSLGYRDPIPGFAAPPVSWTQHAPILGTTSAALEIGSIGGRGGSVTSSDPFRDMAGKSGGQGGNVSLVVSKTANLSGTLKYALKPSEQSSPLISIYSKGGTGGRGYRSVWSSEGGIARGGDGGAVLLQIASHVTATAGANPQSLALPAIRAVSEGGAAGRDRYGNPSTDGTLEHRVAVDAGGDGGTITLAIDDTARIDVIGALAPAISATSSGGAGGNALNSGGHPSNGGRGGRISFANAGKITTKGNDSAAVTVQSVGGSGGHGAIGGFGSPTPGSKGGAGGTIEAVNKASGSIATEGNYSFGIVAQSVGGIGGKGGYGGFVSGGDGGAAGLGGEVTVTNQGTISTTGTGASAIVAQSIGGANALDAFHAATPEASMGGGGGAGGKAGLFASGGKGGLGGVGSHVMVRNSGFINTAGNSAYGVLAQSVGGGGGTGGTASSASAFLAVALGERAAAAAMAAPSFSKAPKGASRPRARTPPPCWPNP